MPQRDSSDKTCPLLQLESIYKTFPGVKALSDVSLQLDRGEIVAVVGENGAGKSTLMKILAGIYPADQGTVTVDGQMLEQGSVRDSMRLGISLIHQELNLAENLSIAENIFLGSQPHRGPDWFQVTHRSEMFARTSAILSKLKLGVSPQILVSQLSIAQRQLVEVAKALSKSSRILVFDEPTSSLTMTEADRLLGLIESLREQGVAVLYVTHHLREVERLADRVVVLRDGLHVRTLSKDQASQERMISLMVGRNIDQFYHRTKDSVPERKALLEVRKCLPGRAENAFEFQICEGEIVGFAGLVGAGRTELAHAIFGIDRDWSGEVLVGGETVPIHSPTDAISAGLALVPEDRQRHGLLLSMTLWSNICLTVLAKLSKWGWRQQNAEKGLAERMIHDLRVRSTSVYQIAGQLSGGNQQKVVLGKWLASTPRVLILDEPTRGIDIGAKSEVYRLIAELARGGLAVMMISSEMEEIVGMSDRVYVMREGLIVGHLERNEISEESVLALAIGADTTQNEAHQ